MDVAGDYNHNNPFILSVDIGSTTMVSQVIDRRAGIKSCCRKKLSVLRPKAGWVEYDPEQLFSDFVSVAGETINQADLSADQITSLAISTHRGSFLTFDRESGQPFHNFISWQDMRTADMVKEWNQSFRMRVFNTVSSVLYFFTRQNRYLSASIYRLMTAQVGPRLMWALDNVPKLHEAVLEGRAAFAALDTWLLWKLTKGKKFATEQSNASATALYDTFVLEWSTAACQLLNIPINIFPPVLNSNDSFGCCEPDILGAAIPICALVADQSAAMFGECCFSYGDVKLTMGTGSFLDILTRKPHASMTGLYPLVGWAIDGQTSYLAEAGVSDTGNAVEWAKSLGLIDCVEDCENTALSVEDSGGVFFVPGFSGLQAPINNDKSTALFVGMKLNTEKCHLVRALLESLAFRVMLLYETALQEINHPLQAFRADGGVTKNKFVMQLISDLIGRPIEQCSTEMSCLGAAYLAGLRTGIWANKEELENLRKPGTIFHPSKESWEKYRFVVERWREALQRSLDWYKTEF